MRVRGQWDMLDTGKLSLEAGRQWQAGSGRQGVAGRQWQVGSGRQAVAGREW